MKRIRCLAIDDEPIALQKLEKYIGKIPFLELVALCDSPFEAMQEMTKTTIDAVFVDINMPDLNGMEFIASLPQPPKVIFITAHAEYAVESYRLSAVDYLLKPYDFADFQRAVNKLVTHYLSSPEPTPTTHLLVKEGYKYVNIKIADILYVKGLNEYVQVFTLERQGKPIVAYITMKQLRDKLPQNFLQVHRSYIVNTEHIREIERMRITIDEHTLIPISDNYKKDFMEYLRTHSLEKTPRKDCEDSADDA